MGKESLNKKFSTSFQKSGLDHDEIITDARGADVLEGQYFEGVSPDIINIIETAIYDFCNYECTPPIEDLSREKQTRFTALCLYIGNTVFKRYNLIRDANKPPKGGKLQVDFDKMALYVPVWLHYCNKYNKTTLSHCFLAFVGLYVEFAGKMGNEVTPSAVEILKKLRDFEKSGLKDSIVDGSRNPTGAIAILNNEHGYGQNVARIQIETKTAISAENLPVLGIISGDNANIAETIPHFETENTQ